MISIEVGDRYALWEQDWKIPLHYGMRQIFGENGGPGGLFHSLRIIPPILKICEGIQAICPDAYVINFSNPLSRVCLAIHRKYPDLKLVGFCHEVASLPQHLPFILETPLSNLEFKAGGLNHFSVLLEIKYKDSNQDAYPDVRAKAPRYFESLPPLTQLLREGSKPPEPQKTISLNPRLHTHPERAFGAEHPSRWADRGLFKVILEEFGYLPITEDSHFGEYIHWAYEVADLPSILDFFTWYKEWSLQKTQISRIESIQADEYWRIVPIMEGILTDSHHEELAINITNTGLIDNLPSDLVVEVPAVIDGMGFMACN